MLGNYMMVYAAIRDYVLPMANKLAEAGAKKIMDICHLSWRSQETSVDQEEHLQSKNHCLICLLGHIKMDLFDVRAPL